MMLCQSLLVSIRTPARGVTTVTSISSAFEVVSIRTPARGVTCLRKRRDVLEYGFNPHAREGRDPLPDTGYPSGIGFNPHAREGRDMRNR